MRLALVLIAVVIVGTALGAAAAPPAATLRPPEAFLAIADPSKRSRAMFTEMMRVIGSPRCLNCHPATQSPLQGDAGRPHRPPITPATMSSALSCGACHHDHNTPVYAGRIRSIPGIAGWGLAPPSMAWVGKTPAAICRQLKDPDANGDRDLAALAAHMATDHLVGWAWNPGLGRTKAPGTQADFGRLAHAWIDSGAKCPA